MEEILRDTTWTFRYQVLNTMVIWKIKMLASHLKKQHPKREVNTNSFFSPWVKVLSLWVSFIILSHTEHSLPPVSPLLFGMSLPRDSWLAAEQAASLVLVTH